MKRVILLSTFHSKWFSLLTYTAAREIDVGVEFSLGI